MLITSGRTSCPWYHLNSEILLHSLQYGNFNHSDIASLDNGGNLRWSLLRNLCSIQSSKATSMLPSRRFSPTIFSLFFRNSMYSSSSTLLPVIVNYNCITNRCCVNSLFDFLYLVYSVSICI